MNLFAGLTFDEIRSICRSNIEAFEVWARRLIDAKMNENYGENFLDIKDLHDAFILKKEFRERIARMRATEPERFPRTVDAFFAEDIEYILCHQAFYKKLFSKALDYIYPQGREEAREFLKRLVPIRNALSHANPISMRQAEQAVCYTHDFIEGLKQYYKDKGEEKVWNVPRIISIRDSVGNKFENPTDNNIGDSIFHCSQPFRCGDEYSVEVEVDPSFNANDYQINWEYHKHNLKEFNNKAKVNVIFENTDVGEFSFLRCTIISNKAWHKYRSYDCKVAIELQVLPPIE